MAQCKGKIKHKSYNFAKIALKELRKQKGLTSIVYKCNKCGYYHIGKPSFKQNPYMFLKNINILIDEQNKKLGIIKEVI